MLSLRYIRVILFNLALCYQLVLSVQHRNNVCRTYEDYNNIENNPNCWYDPDVDDEIDVIIKRHGYPLERYKVTASDGYISNVFRLPKKESRGIVLLAHPASGSATAWVCIGNHSFAFLLWDRGYDVWLVNSRGSYYAREHISLNPNEAEYWDFSFEEIGTYDLRAQVEFVRKITNYRQKVICSGHSMGSTALMTYASLNNTHAEENVKVFLPISAGLRFKHIKSNLAKWAAELLTLDMLKLFTNINVVEVIPRNGFYFTFHRDLCMNFGGLSRYICSFLDSLIYGNTPEEMNPEWEPVIHSQYPAGLSLKCYMHFAQCIRENGSFSRFDYGPDKNMALYGTREPPQYPVWDIKVPVYLVYGSEDLICSAQDQEDFFAMLPEIARKYGKMRVENFSHSDTLYGKHVKDRVYIPIINFLDSLEYD